MKKGKIIQIMFLLFLIIVVTYFVISKVMVSETFSPKEYSYQPLTENILDDQGLYYMKDNIAQYYDRRTEKQITLESNKGDSYYENSMGMLLYNNKLYCITLDTEKVEKGCGKETLYECNCDGSNRRKLFDFPAGCADSMYAFQGKLYYTFGYYNVDKQGELLENGSTTNSLRVYDLKTEKNHTLYTVKQKDGQHNGSIKICQTDDRNQIYCLYRYYDGKMEKGNDFDSFKQCFRSTFFSYNIKTKKVKKCFDNIAEKSFIEDAAVYQNTLFCFRRKLEYENEETYFESYDEDKEVIMKGTKTSRFSFLNGNVYITDTEYTFLYNIQKKICYRQCKGKNYLVVAISASGKYIALDDGDYSDLKDGDVYTKSRFVPKILSRKEFLQSYEVYKGKILTK